MWIKLQESPFEVLLPMGLGVVLAVALQLYLSREPAKKTTEPARPVLKGEEAAVSKVSAVGHDTATPPQ